MTARRSGTSAERAADGGHEARIAGAVLAWGVPRLRDLPWRHTRDPWAILVSEVMLQQTQAVRVAPKWSAFMAVYSTPDACAEASLGDVLRLWEGLGYPRRARNLHAAARMVAEQFAGSLPAELEGLLALPGVGPYTARAVQAFAYGLDAAVVDTNVARVLARTTGRRLGGREVQQVADSLVPAGEGWAWNQVMLDLGATVCTARSPACSRCPVVASCSWALAGRPEPDPAFGSANVSTRQSRFEGSDRQARGRLLRAAARRPLHGLTDAARVAGLTGDEPRVERLLAALEAEGLIVSVDGGYRLP